MKRLYVCSILFLLLSWQISLAQIPSTISYQGVLVNATGSPVADGNYNLTFKLYEMAAGGAPLWSETQSVVVISGIFNVYNSIGEEIATLVDQELTAGKYKVNWEANGLGSGVYFYRLQAGDFAQTRKLVLMR